MKCVLTVTLLILVSCTATRPISNGPPSCRPICEMKERIYAASPDELQEFMMHPDCEISLCAAWERILRSIPEKDSIPDYSGGWDEKALALINPDKGAFLTFVELLEKHLGEAPPILWLSMFESVEFYHRGNAVFSPEGTAVTNREDEYALYPDRSSVLITENKVYIALYHSGLPLSFNLYAIDLRSGSVAWIADVQADDYFDYGGGMGWHHVELLLVNNTVCVFGISGIIAYVEVFSSENGGTLWKFGTVHSDGSQCCR